jgi:hypothetical protein
MAYEQKPNEGTLFANKDKQSDAHPNAKGSALIGGVEYWVSAWTNTAQTSGDRYQKLKFTPKDQAGKPVQKSALKAAPVADELNDEIPF